MCTLHLALCTDQYFQNQQDHFDSIGRHNYSPNFDKVCYVRSNHCSFQIADELFPGLEGPKSVKFFGVAGLGCIVIDPPGNGTFCG